MLGVFAAAITKNNLLIGWEWLHTLWAIVFKISCISPVLYTSGVWIFFNTTDHNCYRDPPWRRVQSSGPQPSLFLSLCLAVSTCLGWIHKMVRFCRSQCKDKSEIFQKSVITISVFDSHNWNRYLMPILTLVVTVSTWCKNTAFSSLFENSSASPLPLLPLFSSPLCLCFFGSSVTTPRALRGSPHPLRPYQSDQQFWICLTALVCALCQSLSYYQPIHVQRMCRCSIRLPCLQMVKRVSCG